MTWLIAREDYIKFSRRESSKNYRNKTAVKSSKLSVIMTFINDI